MENYRPTSPTSSISPGRCDKSPIIEIDTLPNEKNVEGELPPPIRAAILPHILRANFIAMRDKSCCITCPKLPNIEEKGWELKDDQYTPVTCLELPAPKAVLELQKCSCKAICSGRCSCFKHGLSSTPLCKCYQGNCNNPIRMPAPIDDVEEDEEVGYE